jgi:hypothetical protein
VLNLLIHPVFLGFDTLWNTPLGKCYNSTSVRLWTLVIVRITIWSFLASLLGTKLSIEVKKCQQKPRIIFKFLYNLPMMTTMSILLQV